MLIDSNCNCQVFSIQSIKYLTMTVKQINSYCNHSRSVLKYIYQPCHAYLLLTLPASKTAKANLDENL
jgi:hypothetical protein